MLTTVAARLGRTGQLLRVIRAVWQATHEPTG